MRKAVLTGVLLVLAGCASPTLQMTDAQVSSLPDEQICKYKNNYRNETKLEAEIARRNLNCDRFYRRCLDAGNQPDTKAMDFCVRTLRENERLAYDNDYPLRGRAGMGIYNTIGIGR